MKKNNNVLKTLITVLVLVITICGSLAYFTDYSEVYQSGTAGTLDIELINNINLLDEDGKDILNPGDMRSASITINNLGNKSADIRLLLRCYVEDGKDLYSYEGFMLYHKDDVEYIEGKGWQPKENAMPVGFESNPRYCSPTRNEHGYVVEYYIPEFILNGNETLPDMKRELEVDVATDKKNFDVSDGGSSVTIDYVLLFYSEAGNEFQGITVAIEVEILAKQHRNTASLWEEWKAPEIVQPE